MRTFTQFTEEFWKGTDHGFAYTEIFKNPSPSEMAEFGKEELGAWVGEKDIYIWLRANAEHKDIRHILPPEVANSKLSLPLYVFYTAATKTLEVTLSSFSYGRIIDSEERAAITARLKMHPALKKFVIVYQR